MSEVLTKKRESGKWEYSFETPKVDGKRKRISRGGFPTKKAAYAAGLEAKNLFENGGVTVVTTSLSVADMLDAWLSETAQTDLKPTTVAGYKKKIETYIKPVIGQYDTKAVSRQTLQELLTDMTNRGYAKNTVTCVRGVITASFDWAEYNHLIAHSPAYRLKIPKNPTTKQRTDPHIYITPAQMDTIFERFPEGHPSHLPLMLAYHCGLRLGEVFGLIWDDIDLESKTLTVARQVQWQADTNRTDEEKRAKNGSSRDNGGFWYFSHPKYNSYRTIDLDSTIVALLERERDKQQRARVFYQEHYRRYYAATDLSDKDISVNAISESGDYEIDFVCRRDNGEYVSPRTQQHTAHIIHTDLCIPDYDFHSLRHTHATELRSHGTAETFIQHRLGHSKIETTHLYDQHLTDIDRQDGLAHLNEIF